MDEGIEYESMFSDPNNIHSRANLELECKLKEDESMNQTFQFKFRCTRCAPRNRLLRQYERRVF
jgi:hypothetical protein